MREEKKLSAKEQVSAANVVSEHMAYVVIVYSVVCSLLSSFVAALNVMFNY